MPQAPPWCGERPPVLRGLPSGLEDPGSTGAASEAPLTNRVFRNRPLTETSYSQLWVLKAGAMTQGVQVMAWGFPWSTA